MTTLASVRALVRQDLHDEDNTAYLWTDAVLDRHITHAVNDYSLACPLEQKSTLTTTAGSRDLSVTSLTDLIAIERVEWPTGSFPPEFVGFSLWADTLTLDVVAAPASVQNVNVYWTKKHALGASSTIPTEHEDLIAVGAVAYAATDRETLAINKINLGGDVWGPVMREPLIGDASSYAYGIAHPIYELRVTTLAPPVAEAHAFGAGAFGESIDYTAAAQLGATKELMRDATSTTGATAAATAAARLRRRALDVDAGHLASPPNVGTELYDVIDITDAPLGLVAALRRVRGVHWRYLPLRGVYDQRLELMPL